MDCKLDVALRVLEQIPEKYISLEQRASIRESLKSGKASFSQARELEIILNKWRRDLHDKND